MIPYGRQDVTQSDIDAVTEVLQSDYLTQGPVIPRFEQAIADYCQAGHAVAVNSATAALHIACRALGLGEGDWLWTSPVTFVASANCGIYCGAKVDFVDIDPLTYNLCPDALEQKLVMAEVEGRLPKIVVPVHLCGQSADMERISVLAKRYGFSIIEDASHAVGGRYQDHAVGSCQFSDIAVFSFHPVKIITTAEGGMALTNDQQLADRMARLRTHGITRDPDLMTHEPDGPWYYQQIELGYNYRITELQAALGLSQLERLDEYVERRHQRAAVYDRRLSGLPLHIPLRAQYAYSAFHLYVIRLDLEKTTKSHRQVFEELQGHNIGVNLHYIPVHLQPYYREFGFKEGDFPKAEQYYREAISIPLYPTMTDDQQDQVINALEQVLM